MLTALKQAFVRCCGGGSYSDFDTPETHTPTVSSEEQFLDAFEPVVRPPRPPTPITVRPHAPFRASSLRISQSL